MSQKAIADIAARQARVPTTVGTAAAPLGGVQQRFRKNVRASDKPSALGNVYAVYPDAIQLMEPAGSARLRGVGLMAFLVMMALVVWSGVESYRSIDFAIRNDLFGLWSMLFEAFIFLFLFFVARHWIVAAWRMDMFAADNQPTIFDRKHRKVYQLFTPHDGSTDRWSQIFKPIRLDMDAYDWDDISAEHRTEAVTSGQTVSRIHRLVMVVRGKGKNAAPVAEFNIGNSMAMGPNTVPMLWEHIRRFMQENGPGVPEGEPLQNFEQPRNLWQSMGVVSPFGPRFAWWWDAGKVPVILILLVFPLSFPIAMVWSFCNWISHMTMRKTVWPEEVHQRIGRPIQTSGQT